MAKLSLDFNGIGDTRRKRRGDILSPMTKYFRVFSRRRTDRVVDAGFHLVLFPDGRRRGSSIRAMAKILIHFRQVADAVEKRHVDFNLVISDVALAQLSLDVVHQNVEGRIGGVHGVMILIVVEVEVDILHVFCDLRRRQIRHTCRILRRCSDDESEKENLTITRMIK